MALLPLSGNQLQASIVTRIVPELYRHMYKVMSRAELRSYLMTAMLRYASNVSIVAIN